MIAIGVLKESRTGESRVALSPECAKKLLHKKGSPFSLFFEKGCGEAAGFLDSDYEAVGAKGLALKDLLPRVSILLKIHRPTGEELQKEFEKVLPETLLISFLEPHSLTDLELQFFQKHRMNVIALEAIPRTSRAQAMDVLSSQANIAGYRAVIEAASHYKRFFPLMMTSAGSAKPAKVMILGAGVAGLQAIATAKRLGAVVEAYDVRPEVKEQICSLGAQFVELEISESGSGKGGYAQELSVEAKQRQQVLLTEKLKKMDIIISTANIPGRKAPILITEEAVRGMRPGSVIVDMATPSGGNCPCSLLDQVVFRHGVTIVGWSNYPSLMATDASHFYGQNLVSFLSLLVDSSSQLKLNLEDDILAASLLFQGGIKR